MSLLEKKDSVLSLHLHHILVIRHFRWSSRPGACWRRTGASGRVGARMGATCRASDPLPWSDHRMGLVHGSDMGLGPRAHDGLGRRAQASTLCALARSTSTVSPLPLKFLPNMEHFLPAPPRAIGLCTQDTLLVKRRLPSLCIFCFRKTPCIQCQKYVVGLFVI